MRNLDCVILAAGEGKRMKSPIPKVLHKLGRRHIIDYSLDITRALGIVKPIVVLGFGADKVIKRLPDSIVTVIQKKRLGTADAVKQARRHISSKAKDILVLYGDTPLLTVLTLNKLIAQHLSNSSHATLLTANIDNPSGYGRIYREDGRIIKILEENQLINPEQKALNEINSGVACFKKESLFKFIDKVLPNVENGEYYLTEVIGLMIEEGLKVDALRLDRPDELLGINSRYDLIKAYKIMKDRNIDYHITQGVTILDPDTTYIDNGVKIGVDTVIYPHTIIESDCFIGKNCSIGPFARLRSGCRLDDGVIVGNFIEIVRTRVKSGVNIRHFGYLGDAKIGSGVNIGAGTITANYNGIKKNLTTIQDGAFVGSGSIFVAPVKVGRRSVTGAGCVVTKGHNVPDGATVVGIPARLLKKDTDEHR